MNEQDKGKTPDEETPKPEGEGNGKKSGTNLETASLDAFPDELRDYIKQLRAENAKNRKAAREAEQEKKQREEQELKQKQEWQKLAEKYQADLAKLQTELDDERKAALRMKVAQAIGLPAKLADRIKGDTEDEMTADAQDMLAELNVKKDRPAGHNDAKEGTGSKGGGASTKLSVEELAARKRSAGHYN